MKFLRVQLSTQAWERWSETIRLHNFVFDFGILDVYFETPHIHRSVIELSKKLNQKSEISWFQRGFPHRMTTPPTNLVTSFLEQPAVCRFLDLCFRSSSFFTNSCERSLLPRGMWLGLIFDLTKVLRLLSEHPWGNDGDPTGCSLLRGHWIRFWGLNKFPASFWKTDICKKKRCVCQFQKDIVLKVKWTRLFGSLGCWTTSSGWLDLDIVTLLWHGWIWTLRQRNESVTLAKIADCVCRLGFFSFFTHIVSAQLRKKKRVRGIQVLFKPLASLKLLPCLMTLKLTMTNPCTMTLKNMTDVYASKNQKDRSAFVSMILRRVSIFRNI